MLLMIDNYDSFTFNLVHYFRALGQQVEVHRNDKITLEEIEKLSPKLIVISPGPGDPDQAGISLQIIQKFAGVIPILGVCLGHQCIAQHFGAKIKKARKVMHGKISQIVHNGRGLFTGLDNPLTVTRYHSLIVDHQDFPNELTITAWTETKNKEMDEIMAIEHQTLAIASVQFHPESVLTEQGSQLLKNFIQRCSDVISR
ncbi:anthranilate synthase component II [Thalassotalea castellviae]|uniref:Aminodeoxychorismate/anthranilate synthase component II n=1 Tax=Thalassotalea castellviae TaxID=3075612 RepID=A0ABU3A427_9GAMM|nr:aminodeoxychorismate/anthranilate synthase component II [Thalassotalea sp. W431]MDT0604931.1 aminodeoxychorismate/anthranilate synthase component II [Thalassotalea sp. W431]